MVEYGVAETVLVTKIEILEKLQHVNEPSMRREADEIASSPLLSANSVAPEQDIQRDLVVNYFESRFEVSIRLRELIERKKVPQFCVGTKPIKLLYLLLTARIRLFFRLCIGSRLLTAESCLFVVVLLTRVLRLCVYHVRTKF